MTAEAAQALHNMSAPPRSTLTLRPFQVSHQGAHGREAISNWGMTWFTRVSFDTLLLARWPRWAGPLRSRKSDPGRLSHLRLCGAVAIAREQEGLPTHPRMLESGLGEELGDELLHRAQSLSRSQTLPPMLLATKASEQEKTLEEDPIRALVLLTHLSGRTCEPGGSPLLSVALQGGLTIDLWTAGASRG